MDRTAERWYAAELNRHKRQLLLRQGHAEPAEELYRKAMGIAVEQKAKLWELRAAVSPTRLRRDQVGVPKPATARARLRLVYGGFGTPDLKEAKSAARRVASLIEMSQKQTADYSSFPVQVAVKKSQLSSFRGAGRSSRGRNLGLRACPLWD
jgi:hypothetical protein